jgi:hypothetical protein
LFIAKFEIEYRSGYPVENFDVKSQNTEELGRLANATKLELFLNKDIILNPIFSIKGSKLAIQADGDIIINGALIDLKTSSQINLKNNMRQLIGYWALNKLRKQPIEINQLGVYYPRFDYFTEFQPSNLMTHDQQNNILDYFRKRLGSNISEITKHY